jgi:hypothetical protein
MIPLGYLLDNHVLKPNTDDLLGGYISEVKLIRRIFERAASGEPLRALARWMNDTRIPSIKRYASNRTVPTGSPWTWSRLSRIIRNTTYKGERVWGKGNRPNPDRLPPVECAGVVPLVSAELWHAAQEGVRRNLRRPSGQLPVPLLRKRITCGTCGGSMGSASSSGTSHRYYRCLGQTHGSECPGVWVRSAEAEAAAWEQVVEFYCYRPVLHLDDPTVARGDQLKTRYEQSLEAQRAAVLAELAAEERPATLRKDLARLAGELERVGNAYVDGMLSREVAQGQKDKIRQEEAAIRAKLEGLADREKALKDLDERIAEHREKGREIAKTLPEIDPMKHPDLARQYVEQLRLTVQVETLREGSLKYAKLHVAIGGVQVATALTQAAMKSVAGNSMSRRRPRT